MRTMPTKPSRSTLAQPGNAHVVALTTLSTPAQDNATPATGFIVGLFQHQMLWLERDLANVAEDKLIVIATHISLISEASDGNPSHEITGPHTDNFDQLLELLLPFNNVYGLAGHDTSNSWKVEINHEHGWTGQPWIAHTLAEVRGSGWTRGPKDLRGVADAMMEDGNPRLLLLKFDDNIGPGVHISVWESQHSVCVLSSRTCRSNR